MKHITKLGVTIASFSIAASVFAPTAFAKATVKITGNAKKTDNKVVLINANLSSLKQTNVSTVLLDIDSKGGTGGNTIKDTTGGTNPSDPSITTGNVKQETTVSVTGSGNIGSSNPCPCEDSSSKVVISGNGKSSDNTVIMGTLNATSTTQKNTLFVAADVKTVGGTGDNTIKDTTGSDVVSIDTGKVVQTTSVTVGGSANAVGSDTDSSS
jgi:hypothetical protein